MSEEKKQKSDEIKEFGALMLNENKKNYKIRLLTIIGEIEGHETVSNNTKATKYEHLLPQLAEAEESDEVEGGSHFIKYTGWRCGSWTCNCGNDSFFGKTNRFSCPWWKSFYWRSSCCFGRLFLYCTDRNHGCSSGSFKRYFYRCDTESEKYGTYTGQNCQVYCCAL